MLTVKITFPWRRFYATPWGINPTRLREPEWPPSPWRLLRALVSAWFRAHPGQTPSRDCIALIETLGRELPDIAIGKVTFGYTVHWQPNYGAAGEGKPKVVRRRRENAEYKNTRHENHFAAVSGPVLFRWNGLSLSDAERSLLETLLEQLAYFGRAESLCHAELCDAQPTEEPIGWCKPTDGRKIASSCRDVFCPKPGKDKSGAWNFQFTDLWSRRADGLTPDCAEAPPHFVDTLLSTDMRADGAEWRSYQMPEGWPAKWVVRTPRTAKASNKRETPTGPTVAHYLRFSLQCRIPIPVKCTVDVAERFRQSAIKRFKEAFGQDAHSFALSGHPPMPEGVSGDHQHAHFLPTPRTLDDALSIEEMHVWGPCGFTQAELEALMCVRTVHWGASKYPIRPVLVAVSQQRPDFLSSPPSHAWRSLTPYVPPRHFYRGNLHGAKLKQRDSPENQLAAELALCGIACPLEITRIPLNPNDTTKPPLQARWDIARAPGDNPAFDNAVSTETHATHGDYERRIGFFFQLEFQQAVVISRPLGHSSHFGLGLFIPHLPPTDAVADAGRWPGGPAAKTS